MAVAGSLARALHYFSNGPTGSDLFDASDRLGLPRGSLGVT
jgi:hypothetical protein